MVGWVRGGEDFRYAIFFAFGFLEHRKLIGPDGLIFVNAGFHVPACEVATIGARERAGTEASDGRALPKTVVDMAGVERGLFCPGVFEGLTDGALPGGLGDVVICVETGGEAGERKCYIAGYCEPLIH